MRVISFLSFYCYFCGMNDELKTILIKVRELYLKYGIKSITMDDVAHELGISKKTLYLHVTDKNDLVGKIVDNEIQLRMKGIYSCSKLRFNAIEELFEISLFMNKMIREQNPATEHDLKKYYPDHYQKIVKTRRQGMLKYILLNLKNGKEEGLYREDINEEIIAKLYLSRSESTQTNDLFTVEEFTSSRLFIELITYHVRGIATEKGISVLEKKIQELKSENKY
jgi:TetR/AcrR family transcriptional regulator, cholesterol catabolism regulator